MAERVRLLLDSEINPAVAAHGMVDVTLKQGVEARIRELVPEIDRVVDATDHAAGLSPFYR